MEIDKRAEAVLTYWFGRIEETGLPTENRSNIWFSGTEQVDEAIREKFDALVENAINGKLDEWKEHPRSLLALIILLDQFPRNLFRNTPKAFEQDKSALDCCLYAIEKEFDHEVSLIERAFVYMPLMHSENLEMQASSVHAFKSLSDLSFPETKDLFIQFLDFAIRHYEVIKIFGRFPQRNMLLNRENTPEEKEFLEKYGMGW